MECLLKTVKRESKSRRHSVAEHDLNVNHERRGVSGGPRSRHHGRSRQIWARGGARGEAANLGTKRRARRKSKDLAAEWQGQSGVVGGPGGTCTRSQLW
jgi:hypothetical protein